MDEVFVPRSNSESIDINAPDKTRPEKRRSINADLDDDEWTLISKKRNTNTQMARSHIDTTFYEVSIIADESLPKQIALAKLLKMGKITNVTNVKYKSPFKLILKFEKKVDADKLVDSSIFKKLGYRCQFTNEVSFTYGIVKYIENDIIESDLQKLFSCESEIVSVKRLKRLNENKEWSDSETVRFCFKSNTLPSYVYGSDSRFRVEPYTFPVSQCKSCWRFGHLTKFCMNKKKICPKCSGDHENCEATSFKCINCKGEHTAYDRSCSTFIKEKKIRHIMCHRNCTYKVALDEYLNKNKGVQKSSKADCDSDTIEKNSSNKSLVPDRHILNWDSLIPDQNSESDDQTSNRDPNTNSKLIGFKKRKNKKNNITNHNIKQAGKKMSYSEVTKMMQHNKEVDKSQIRRELETGPKEKHDVKEEFSFLSMAENIKNIFTTQVSFEEKLIESVKYLCIEVCNYLRRVINIEDIISSITTMFH